MSEPTLLLVGLKNAAPTLFKLLPSVIARLPHNSPARKAIANTATRYSSRVHKIESALESWILSEPFKSVVEALQSGPLAGTDSTHIDLFIETTGIGLGTISLETASDILAYFYHELSGQLLGGEDGHRILGARIDEIGIQVTSLKNELLQLLGSDAIPYRTSVQLDFKRSAVTEHDHKAEIQLDLVKGLIEKRKPRTALELLLPLQSGVDSGELSPTLRFRFFVNKGVCLMLSSQWDEAEQELLRAQTLDPKNSKALINLAQVLILKGKPNDAFPHLQRVLGSEAAEPTVYGLLLACLHGIGDHQQIASLLASQPELTADEYCQYALANIAYSQGKFTEAEQYLRRHNESDNTFPEAWELLGRVILVPAQDALQGTQSPEWIPEDILGRLRDAESSFSRAEQLLISSESNRELKFTLNNRGLTRMLLGLDEDARKDFELALHIDQTLDEAKRNLGLLLLSTGKPEEALRILGEIGSSAIARDVAPLIATAYLDMGQACKAKTLLESILDSGDERQQILSMELLLTACQRLQDMDSSSEIVRTLSSNTTNPEASRVLAQYYSREGDFQQAKIFAQQAVKLAEGTNPNPGAYRIVLADILYQAIEFEAAAEEYERAQIPLNNSPQCRHLLISLFNADRLKKAMHVAQFVRNGGPAIADFSEIEALIFERIGDLDRANALRQELLSLGVSSQRQKLRMAFNQIRRGNRAEAKALVMEVDLASIDEDSDSLQDAAKLRTLLELPNALVFAFQLLQILPDDADSHLFYVSTFVRREAIDANILRPDTVGVDCVVTLGRGNEKREWTVADQHTGATNNTLPIEHALVKEMLGKRTGETFQFQKGELSETQLVIEAIQSKYVKAFQDSMDRFNERFPTSDGLQRIDFDPTDTTKISQMLNQQKERADRIIDLYRTGMLPACSIARLFGKADVEMFRSLVEDRRIKVLSFDGSGGSIQAEMDACFSAKELFLEASALVTIHSLGLLDKVSLAFDALWITQFTLDELTQKVIDNLAERETGYMVSDALGRIQLVSRTMKEIADERLYYQQLLKFLETKCSIAAHPVQNRLERPASVRMYEILGDEAMSTIAVALETRYLMVSDDLPLRRLAKNENDLNSVGTLALLRRLRSLDLLTANDYHGAIHWLRDHGYSFVPFDKDDIVWVLQKNQWLPSPEVAEFLQCLSDPDCDLAQVIRVGLDVLYELWNRMLPTSTQRLCSELVIGALVRGRNGVDVLRRLRGLNQQRSLIWTPAMYSIRDEIESWLHRIGTQR